jgi:hypothetical protein
VIGVAIMVGRIAIGELENITTEDGKNAAAVALGRMLSVKDSVQIIWDGG